MIPKSVEDKIDSDCDKMYPLTGSVDAYVTTYEDSEIAQREGFKEAAQYGYTLAMEQMKPILDAAREASKGLGFQPNFSEVNKHWDAVGKLSQLLNQHDNETK